MKLKDYFVQERIDPVRFAVDNGFSVTSIYRYMRGGKPHFPKAIALERATKGKVTVQDLRGINVL